MDALSPLPSAVERTAELEGKLRRASTIADVLSAISESPDDDFGLGGVTPSGGQPPGHVKRDSGILGDFNGLKQALAGRHHERKRSQSKAQMDAIEVRSGGGCVRAWFAGALCTIRCERVRG